MKTLEQHNAEKQQAMDDYRKPLANGIQCPSPGCGAELRDTQPNEMLTSNPPCKHVHCASCGWRGYALT